MWKFVRKYLHYAVIGALLMVGEVFMDLLQPGIMRIIVDDGVLGSGSGDSNLRLIINYGIWMILIALFGGLCGSLNTVFVNMAAHGIGNELRKACYRTVMGYSFSRMDRSGAGTLINRLTGDITQVQSFFAMLSRGLVRTTFMTAGSIFFMFMLDPAFGITVLVAFPVIVGVLGWFLMKLTPRYLILQSQIDRINTLLQEDLSGIRIIKACVRELYVMAKFGEANAAAVATQIFIMTVFAFINPVINLLTAVLISLVILLGSSGVDTGTASTGAVMAGITYLTQLLHSLMMMIMLFQGISRGRASLSRISEIMKEDLSLKNGSFVPEKPLKGKIEFQNVSFSYPGDESDTLKGIDLTVEPGETVAVIGSTGSGKSTLTGLIDRFYDVNGGRILIDGVDVKDYDLSTLRNSISYTLQKSELFSMSIADNIRWGRPDADDSEVRAAASVAQADSFISEQPEGYDTLVAEDGRSLSGGQRQRIAIARSVIRNAPIMIFDDSTSALDLTTESRFFRALRNCRPDCTKIIVAQRISTVAGADRIIILDHGRVAAQGKHDQLLESCELYRELYRSQIGDEAVLS